jgi:hypothetical protein
VFGLEPFACMDAAPGHADREQTRSLCRLDVERRVTDVSGLTRACAHPLEREQQGLRIGLVPRRLVSADDRLEQMSDRNPREGKLDGLAPLCGDDPQPPPLVLQTNQHLVHPRAADELVVQRLVMRAIDVDELVDLVWRESMHLRLETGAADRRHQLLVGNLSSENLLGGVPHRRKDDRAGVDDCAVEIEEDDRKPHAVDASQGENATRPTRARCSRRRASHLPTDRRRGEREPRRRS